GNRPMPFSASGPRSSRRKRGITAGSNRIQAFATQCLYETRPARVEQPEGGGDAGVRTDQGDRVVETGKASPIGAEPPIERRGRAVRGAPGEPTPVGGIVAPVVLVQRDRPSR